jgi:hypothetical protein
VHEQVDENTGMSAQVIMESSDEKKQPRIEIKDEKGKTQKKYPAALRRAPMVEDSAEVSPGDVLAKIPREIMGRLIPAGTGMEYYRRVKIPEEIIERPTTGLEGATYEAEYLVARSTSRKAPKSSHSGPCTCLRARDSVIRAV